MPSSKLETGRTRPLRPGVEERLKTFQLWWQTQPFSREERKYTKGESVYLLLREEWEEPEEGPVLEELFSFGSRGEDPVVLESKLGEGGMGEVWSAWQDSLCREVAVKKLKQGSDRQRMGTKLLREAWVTGMLEHPNIVPLHLLGLDAEGSPAFAMKRIQGVSWEDLISGAKELPEGLQGTTTLERHVRILKQVCNAIHFAHSKGIIHRDLKPENIMVGEFGEVYVMDWGIAMCLSPEHEERLPGAEREQGIFGTPAYMAPEIAMGRMHELSPATDVYLLGAALHELLTGEPPHNGDSLYEVLYSAISSEPYGYPPEVPEELAEICHRAMHPEPSERYPSAEAFRQALAGFLTHRESRQLSLETGLRMAQLKAHLRGTPGEDDIQEIYQLFGQVRFGFQQALRTWQGNKQAQRGLQEALEWMIQFELGQKHTRGASILLSELPQPNAELERALAEVSSQQHKERAEVDALKQMAHESDLSLQATSRGRLMLVMALLWGVLPLLVELTRSWGSYMTTARESLVLSGVSVLGSLLSLGKWRQNLGQNAINRNLLMALGLTVFTLSLLWALGLRLELALSQILSLESIPMFGFFAFVAVLVDRRLMPVLYLYAAVPLSSLLYPPLAPYATSLGNTAAFVLLGWIWQQPDSPKAEATGAP